MPTYLMVSHWTKLWWRGLKEAFQVSCKELTWLVLLFGNLIKKIYIFFTLPKIQFDKITANSS